MIQLLKVILTLDVFSFITHLIGLHLLAISYQGCRNKQQRLLLVSLSVNEALFSLLFSIQEIILLTESESEAHSRNTIGFYIHIITSTGLNMTFYRNMFYITIERLVCISCQSQHAKYCTVSTVKYLLGATWMTALVLNIVFCCLYAITGKHFFEWIFQYIFPVLDIVFLLVACISYTFILLVVHRSSKRIGSGLKKFTFVIPLLIVLTFLLFVVLPDLITVSCEIKQGTLLWDIFHILYRIAMISDALLYILICHDVRRMLLQKYTELLTTNIRKSTGLIASTEEHTF